MISKPQHSDEPDAKPLKPEDYLLPKTSSKISPITSKNDNNTVVEENDRNAAVAIIRHKLDKIYANEPDAEEEIMEAEIVRPHSKHQEFMHELSNSGKSLAEIQTEWHHYYVTLPDDEKHQVWQEFYASNTATSKYHKTSQAITAPSGLKETSADSEPIDSGVSTVHGDESLSAGAKKPARSKRLLAVHPAPAHPKPKLKDARSTKEVKQAILHHVSAGGKLKAKHHLQSLLFGLGMGFAVIFIFLFGFFNEFFIAPFIQPSRNASATPLILNTDGVAPTSTPEVIIPKINVEIPVNFDETSTNEDTIENDLESGVVHYPTTVLPGQKGNTAFFGHSSNNIFNKGKYKFAFVLLHTLVPGDTFYLTNNGKVFVYKVITKDIVEPTDVAVLGPVAGQTATATLITCDPPGTSLHRLIIVGQQISPDPNGNAVSTSVKATTSATSAPANLPGNGPTLLSRVWHWIF